MCEKKRFAQKFTDGQTDRQTTDAGRLAIALVHSWNELKTKFDFFATILNFMLILMFDALKQMLANVNIDIRPCNYLVNRVFKMSDM